ncbi:hypothetical protein PanWU01x14_351920 [Parasponia andersonii]|uniref:Uncharacterized protein n=1 Tax=Parasponia andersonii TaxID=3476 RepID=A0A2P5AAJ4_PARAD|nr:hypothetical protein PanWU01x14_351920 [Parasponia andersonii]
MKLEGEDEVAFINNNNSDGTFTCSWEEMREDLDAELMVLMIDQSIQMN